MTAKEYLKQVERMDKQIENLKDRMEEIWTSLTSITVDPSKEVVDGTKTPGMSDGLIEELNKLSKELGRRRLELIIKRGQIELQIQSLSKPIYIEILSRRWLDHIKLDQQIEMEGLAHGKDYSYICDLHRKALNEFGQKFSEEIAKSNSNPM